MGVGPYEKPWEAKFGSYWPEIAEFLPVLCLLLSSGLQVLEEVQIAAGHFGGRLTSLFPAICCLGCRWNADWWHGCWVREEVRLFSSGQCVVHPLCVSQSLAWVLFQVSTGNTPEVFLASPRLNNHLYTCDPQRYFSLRALKKSKAIACGSSVRRVPFASWTCGNKYWWHLMPGYAILPSR